MVSFLEQFNPINPGADFTFAIGKAFQVVIFSLLSESTSVLLREQMGTNVSEEIDQRL
jgi:hypothetical protein